MTDTHHQSPTAAHLWPTSTTVENGRLLIAGCDLATLAAQHGTPLYLLDAATIRTIADHYQTALRRVYAGAVSIHYASKALLNTGLAQLMHRLGLGLDVVSGGELAIAHHAGFPMQHIHLHGNATPPAELAHAVELGIGKIVVDNLDQLATLAQITRNRAQPQPIMVRIAPDIADGAHAHIRTGAAAAKFGMPLLDGTAARGVALSPWRMVIGLGFVSLAADMVADGGKSILGPLLGSLGASGLVIGVVMGAAEAVSLVLRVVAGPLADRSGKHWNWTVVGYGLTVVCVPLLAVAPAMGAAGLAVAISLVLLERVGKAVRSPSKTALLAHAAGAVGRGRGFGVHKTLDLIGAMTGPLLVAAVITATGAMPPALLALVIPGVVTMALLAWLRRRVPDPSVYDGAPAADAPRPVALSTVAPTPRGWRAAVVGADLPREFFLFAVASALVTAGLVSYGLSSYHLVRAGLVPLAAAPVVFAGAMGVAAVAALGTGTVYDRRGPAVLVTLPLLVAAVPPLVLTGGLGWALVGMAGWGAAVGTLDATVKALVADLVPPPRRASAYGVFAAVQGVAALAGGVVIGALYEVSILWLSAFVAACQLGALALLLVVLSRRRRVPTA